MNIDSVDKKFGWLINKIQAGNVAPDRRNLAYDMANKQMFRKYFGVPEGFIPGSQAVAYSVSQQTEEIMSRFKTPASLYIEQTGYSNLPDDFIHLSTATYVSIENGKQSSSPVKICNDTEFQESLSSFIVPATKENPTCNMISGKIRFAPTDLVNAQIIYFRLPKTPKWAFIYVNNRPVYDSAQSVNPEWPDDLEMEFIVTAAQMAGVNMQRTELFQVMGLYKNNNA